jgi:hypothetical protein
MHLAALSCKNRQSKPATDGFAISLAAMGGGVATA